MSKLRCFLTVAFVVAASFGQSFAKDDRWFFTDRFHGTYPPNINEGTHPISVKGPTQYQVVPLDF